MKTTINHAISQYLLLISGLLEIEIDKDGFAAEAYKSPDEKNGGGNKRPIVQLVFLSVVVLGNKRDEKCRDDIDIEPEPSYSDTALYVEETR